MAITRTTARLLLGTSYVAANALLWRSYASQRVSRNDFGNVRDKNVQYYLLIAAAAAYLSNVAYIAVLLAHADASARVLMVALSCVLIYYGLQIGFVPSVRYALEGGGSRNVTRALLIACTVPTVVLAGIGVHLRSGWLTALGSFVALHVTVNDAIVYGFRF